MGAMRWPRFNIGPERLGVIRQYVVAMCASVSGVLCGSAFVWLTPLMPRLLGPHSEVPMTEEELSWTVSIIEIGDLVTPIPAGMLADRLGRKPVLLVSGPAYLAAWLVIAFTRSVPGLYVARLMQGMALGISYTVLPIYLGEIASADIRGRLGIFVQYSWYIGIIFEYSIGPFLSYDRIVWTSLSLTIAFVVMFIWCPESPHFLAMRGRDADAANNLTWLRGGADVSQEMATIREGVENSKATDPASGECCSGGAWRELLATKKGLAALGLGLAVLTNTLMGGLVTMLSYSSIVFTPSSQVTCSLIIGVLLLLTVPVFGRLMDIFGRRPVYLISSGIGFISILLVGVYQLLKPQWIPNWVCDVLVIIYLVFIAGGVEALFPILQAELFSGSARALGSSLMILIATFLSFASLEAFYFLNKYAGFYSNFFVFAFFCLFGFTIVFFYLPETKGKTFEEIQKGL